MFNVHIVLEEEEHFKARKLWGLVVELNHCGHDEKDKYLRLFRLAA